VLVAAADLARGTLLGPSSLQPDQVPARLAPPGAIADAGAALGRALVADLAAGEVLTRSRLAPPGTGPVAALVPPGLRAFVLPSGPPVGTVASGDRVDVLATYGANAGRPYTETVATSLSVLDVVEAATRSIAADAAGAATGPPLVVLADPGTVERLARAASLAVLSIAIVGGDTSPGAPPSASPTPPALPGLEP
jgi:Flp pilus assembly protein CpaB